MRWVVFLCLFLSLPFSNTLDSSNLNPPINISYKIEVWLFLLLFSILIVVIYRKKLGSSNITVEKTQVPKARKSNYVADDFDNPVTEVPIDIPTKVDFSFDKIEGDVKSEELETKVNPSDLAKKLKELKK